MMSQFHHHHHLLLLLSSASRQSLPPIIKPLLLTPTLPSSLLNAKCYSQRKDDNDDHEIGVKARSVAEEFARVAKEKGGSVSQSIEDAWEGTKQAVTETVEKGEPNMESIKNKQEESTAKRAKVEK